MPRINVKEFTSTVRIDLETYVRTAFDGVTCDREWQGLDQAISAIQTCLSARARRSLTPDEETTIAAAVTVEWNRRHGQMAVAS